jgi:hypothetical protein
MKKGWLFLCGLLLLLPVRGALARTWEISSPEHEQTFAFGSERDRQWMVLGNHLGIAIHFTNDPYVDVDNPRRYDDFTFDFPSVTLGPDGRTLYYHPEKGRPVPVATVSPGFLGTEVHLLPNSCLIVEKPHGLLNLTLVVSTSSLEAGD